MNSPIFQRSLPLVAALMLFLLASCGGGDDGAQSPTGGELPTVNNNRNNSSSIAAVGGLEFPRVTDERVLVKRVSDSDLALFKDGISYSIGYDDNYKLPRYVCYKMYKSNRVENVSRWYASNNEYQYPEDTDIPADYRLKNSNDPFWNTGYDHGHMIPSAHRLSSTAANKQTFLLSNMMPQVNGFNAKIWATLENKINDTWNQDRFRDTLYVVTGGSYQKPEYVLGYIGNASKGSRIPVAKYYWKAVLCKNKQGYKAIGFWLEHKTNAETDLRSSVVSIDELERLTGLDFFCNLPDHTENQIEAVPAETIKKSWF